jgi:DNA-binding winged helix-turn-helix (wHTH) protein/tetratricopeptide (TPR) repeat protein
MEGWASEMKEFPPFRLDTVNQCLWRCSGSGTDERILLKPKAFAILRHLVDHPGRLVTQEELLSAVWPDVYVQLDVLKRHIFDIRNELGDDPKCPRFVETLPRRGYQFIAAVRELGWAESATEGAAPIIKLVGRERALGELRACLARVVRGERQTVFVTGEPGIGKTVLVDEFRRQASAGRALRIARGQCVEGYGGKEAYYAVLEAVGKLCRRPDAESAIDILAAQAPTWLVQFPSLLRPERRQMLQREILGTTKQRMLREIGDALETISSETPLLLILEDLHWADPSTVDLVSALARGRSRAKLMVIGTYRPQDLATTAHPLTSLSADLRVHHLCHHIALELLEEEEISAYLDGASAGSAPKGLARVLHRHSEGNPLFMVAALEHMTERGLLSRQSDGWKASVPIEAIDFEVPESLHSMIEAQIERLSPEEQGVLEAASPGTDVFSVAVRSPVANLEPDRFEEACETLSRQHHIVRPAGSRQFSQGTRSPCYQFVHALYREVCYRRIAPSRRSKLHRRIGEQLELLLSERRDENAAELAEHFEKCADWARAVKYLGIAADNAMRVFEPQQAAAILQYALDLAKRLPVPEGSREEIGILEKLAAIHTASFDPAVIPICNALVSRAASSGLIEVQIRTLLKLGQMQLWMNFEEPLSGVQEALDLASEAKNPLLRARAMMRLSFLRLQSSGWSATLADDCQSAVDVIRKSGEGSVLGMTLLEFSFFQFYSSDHSAGYQNAMEGLAACVRENAYLSEAYYLQILAPWNLVFVGQWGQALQEITDITGVMRRNSDYVLERACQVQVQAWLHAYALDYRGVLEICEPALHMLESAEGYRADYRFCCTLIALAELNIGNRERACKLLSATRDDMAGMTLAFDWYYRMPHESVFTEFWLAEGDLTRAREHADKFLKSALATAEHTWQALAWEVSSRIAAAAGDLKHAREDISSALEAMGNYAVPLAAWRVHGTAWELYQSAGDRDLAERHRALSRDTIMKLANSLPLDAALREIFLSAPIVRKVLADPSERTAAPE